MAPRDDQTGHGSVFVWKAPLLHTPIIADEHAAFLVRVATIDDAPWVNSIIGADASELMGRVTTLVSEHGGFFLEPITSGVLEAHMFFSVEGRGKEALHSARTGLGFAFDMLGAAVVFGRIPIEDRAARLFTRIIGFRSDGIRPREPGGPLCEWFEMRSSECPQQLP